MEKYIQEIRSAGYSDWIQVFRICQFIKGEIPIIRWVEMGKPLANQLEHVDGLRLTGINQWFDTEEKLDYLDFNFHTDNTEFQETRYKKPQSKSIKTTLNATEKTIQFSIL